MNSKTWIVVALECCAKNTAMKIQYEKLSLKFDISVLLACEKQDAVNI